MGQRERSIRRRTLLGAIGSGSLLLAGCAGSPEEPTSTEAGGTPTGSGETPEQGTMDASTRTRTASPTGTATPDPPFDLDCRSDAVRPDDDGSEARYRVRSYHEIESVWPGVPADYALLTHGDMQFVAFYDASYAGGEYDRLGGQLTVGQRQVGCGSAWRFVRVDDWVEWDAHNYVTMAVDGQERLHVSGNMHNSPLKYFRTLDPLDVRTLERVDEMVGSDEEAVTYPQFIHDPQGRLVFEYRSGGSGSGVRIYNVYDATTGLWSRLLDEPLLDGSVDDMNTYPVGPELGPDGHYHLVWVWRDTPDASTNHDLSYARSPNLADWERSDGTALSLPITYDEADIVDPVPSGGGMINGNTHIGFDSQERVILSYHKFDDEGNTQIYNARREADGWEIYETSDWDYRWEFGGGGTLEFEITLSGVGVEGDRLLQSYDHAEYGSGTWELDEETLQPVGELDRPPRYPESARAFEAEDDRLRLNWAEDLGSSGEEGVQYALRWPTLPSNRDEAYSDVPPPTSLRLYEFERVA